MKYSNLTLGSLFDGIGGFPYAASFYGIRALWASEILPDAVSVTRRHFPEMEQLGDIKNLDGRTLPPVDIVTFGSPCQGLSLAGRRQGLADERSGLFLEAIRIIREMREVTHGAYPRIALWENVPGALSSAGGRDFKTVLESFTEAEIPMPHSGRWANAGMVRGAGVDLAWCVYDAQYFGTAQRRRRVFLVSDFTGRNAGEILFVPKSLRGYFEAGGTPRQGIAAFAESGADAADDPVIPAALKPEPWVEILNDQGGDSLTVERRDIAPTLRCQSHGNLPVVALGLDVAQATGRTGLPATEPGQTHVLARGTAKVENGQVDARFVHPDVAGTLCASGAGMTRPGGMGSELDLCVMSAGFRYKAASAAGSVGYQEEKAPTLTAGQPTGILKAYVIGAYHSAGMLSDNPSSGCYEARTARTLDRRGGDPCAHQGGVVVVKADNRWQGWELVVRRLTPVECERLQGFPDGWTEYGADGKIISDTRRYQMLGNSVAVPCVAYIMQGIVHGLA